MFKRKNLGLIIALLLSFLTIDNCQCEKDKNHLHKEGTDTCEICHQKCDCIEDTIEPCFEYDPGIHW